MTAAQAAARRRAVGQMCATGVPVADIRRHFGLVDDATTRRIIAAAVRHGFIREADLPPGSLPHNKTATANPMFFDPPAGLDPRWRERAACRDGAADPEAFHPRGYDWTTGDNPERAEHAKEFCRRHCKVIEECRIFADAANDVWSIRGAMTPDERRKARRNARTRARTA
jgi:WhiB family transcriptional regulator, redox-sensing transcriptional regulator